MGRKQTSYRRAGRRYVYMLSYDCFLTRSQRLHVTARGKCEPVTGGGVGKRRGIFPSLTGVTLRKILLEILPKLQMTFLLSSSDCAAEHGNVRRVRNSKNEIERWLQPRESSKY